MNPAFKNVHHTADLCIVGGGLAGTIAAIAAARRGVKVVLIQDRPVLGGNSSSEIRMWVRGAKGKFDREGGILAEFEEENIFRNPTLSPSLWDSVLFGKVKVESNIELLLNTSCCDAVCEKNKIQSVTAWQLTTYSYHTVKAKYFADCSGDSVLAPLSGALHRVGRENKTEYDESLAPDKADACTMGMSVLLQARETDHPVPFIPPEWANRYENDECFDTIPYKEGTHSTKRDHIPGTNGCNLWWMELGGDGEAIANTEETRDELIKVAFGVWDHIKNYGDHGAENWELEWVGFLPGKRESVRYIGEHILTQSDIENGGKFDDVIAYGGWPMDDHNPLGMKAIKMSDAPSQFAATPSPYGIPFRCLYSRNIKNLFFAGRNISATHIAMSSTRVMATCSLLGQAVGTAAAVCLQNSAMPGDLKAENIKKLQQILLTDGVFLPGVKREIDSVNNKAIWNISSDKLEILLNGIDRPRIADGENGIVLETGDKIELFFDELTEIGVLRLAFDPDYRRKSVSPNFKMQWFAQKLNTGRDFVPVKVPATIVKAFEVCVDDEPVCRIKQNYHSLVKIPLHRKCKRVSIRFEETNGAEQIKLFGCDII